MSVFACSSCRWRARIEASNSQKSVLHLKVSSIDFRWEEGEAEGGGRREGVDKGILGLLAIETGCDKEEERVRVSPCERHGEEEEEVSFSSGIFPSASGVTINPI